METGIDKAIRIAGSQTALANLLGLTPQAVQKWKSAGVVSEGMRCKQIEELFTGQVTRLELNPPMFAGLSQEEPDAPQAQA